MSLFPAYSGQTAAASAPDAPDASEAPPATAEWLENNSFALEEEQLRNVARPQLPDTSSSSTESAQPSDADADGDGESESRKHRKKRAKRKKHEKHTDVPAAVVVQPIEFVGDEEYYVDKAPAKQYKTVRTLHKPACPRYRRDYNRLLGRNAWRRSIAEHEQGRTLKRYYRLERAKDLDKVATAQVALDEDEYSTRLGALNRRLMESPSDLQVWLDLMALHERNPYKWSRLLLAEKKIDLLLRALNTHPRSDRLYRMYIETINATYPAFEVSKLLDRLLSKDPYNYTLWTAQIMATQGSMARCLVPDVLSIYERCMQKMHHHQQHDEIMLKLFSNCALFLRQAGLYEQFFALVKLALELNVSTERFGDFAPLDADQQTLIEYEELILQSGLPMNEIWLRIEKLRQGFNFLPCPQHVKCSDPQRVVFNEDVCHYIYPLKSRENAFYLMLLVLRLLKLPFVQCDGLAERFSARVEHIGDSDAIEDVLAVCVRRCYALPLAQQDEFLASLNELAREMAVCPTFLANSIGHEIYVRCITEMLHSCAAAFEGGVDERKRVVFLLLWCRFERLLLVLHNCGRHQPAARAEYVRAGRARFKALLKQPPNRSVLNFYTEFALYEYEALGSPDTPAASVEPVQRIFENMIAAHATDDPQAADLLHAYACYAEVLIGRGLHEAALQAIAAYAFRTEIKEQQQQPLSTARQLAALHRLCEQCDTHVAAERNVEAMVLEQYLLPDYTVALLKLRCYLDYLVHGHHTEARAHLDELLRVFHGGAAASARHNFLREHILELYATLLQLPCTTAAVPNALVTARTFDALAEYPRNLHLLQRCSMLSSPPWYKLRGAILGSTPTILSIVFLIALARYRFLQSPPRTAPPTLVPDPPAAVSAWDHRFAELIIRNRILNVFQSLTPTATPASSKRPAAKNCDALQRNALFWRFYLRCISDQSTAFDTSKKCLLTALDECPWSKALYLDGATYVPQELSHLQDLIIEKQLRICALPEELEILREQ